MKTKIPTFVLLIFALFLAVNSAAAEEESVKPGINEKFLDPALKVDEWLKRFETESREIFHAREAVLKTCGITEGSVIADVGAGTGLYTRLFSQAVGADGWVYAVDINPRFLEHIHRQGRGTKSVNVTTVLCPEDSVGLARESVDLLFICDTYHHFEYPKSTLASIHSALRPGGTFIVIDFERIEGVTREWLMGHVRAGKGVFKQEILDSGFEFIEEVEVDGLEENYFLRFRKPNVSQ